MMARIGWEREHRGDLDRTAALDRQIDFSQRLERAASRGVERGVERGLGIEL